MSFSEDFIAAYESAARSRVEAADWKQRAETAEARVAELEAQNARLRTALLRLNRLYLSCFDYDELAPKPEWLKTALAGTEEAK